MPIVTEDGFGFPIEMGRWDDGTFLRRIGLRLMGVKAAEYVWPVGSVFLSVVPTNPATLLGTGTWVAIGAGRMLVGYDAGDPDFDAAEKTGGAKTVTLTEAQLPAHRHALSNLRGLGTGSQTTGYSGITAGSDTSSTPTPYQMATTGSGEAHNNLPPYLVVFLWKRVA